MTQEDNLREAWEKLLYDSFLLLEEAEKRVQKLGMNEKRESDLVAHVYAISRLTELLAARGNNGHKS